MSSVCVPHNFLLQRVDQRTQFDARLAATISSVKDSSAQCKSTVPLLQTSVSEANKAESSVRERIATQTTTSVVLMPMQVALQAVFSGVRLRSEQVAQFLKQQFTLISDVGAVVTQVWSSCPLSFCFHTHPFHHDAA